MKVEDFISNYEQKGISAIDEIYDESKYTPITEKYARIGACLRALAEQNTFALANPLRDMIIIEAATNLEFDDLLGTYDLLTKSGGLVWSIIQYLKKADSIEYGEYKRLFAEQFKYFEKNYDSIENKILRIREAVKEFSEDDDVKKVISGLNNRNTDNN